MFKSVLVAVDGSENNRSAVDAAITLAKEQGAKLTALSVFDPGGYGNYAAIQEISDQEKYIEQVSTTVLEYFEEKSRAAGIEAETKTVVGDPATKIVELSPKYDLVICGTLGRTGFNRLIMGSVAEKVVRLSACPVLVYRK